MQSTQDELQDLCVCVCVCVCVSVTHQRVLEPELSGDVLPLVLVDDKVQSVKQRGRHVAMVQLKELTPHLWVRGAQPVHEGALHLDENLVTQLLCVQGTVNAYEEKSFIRKKMDVCLVLKLL